MPAKRVPGQIADDSMILVAVVTIVSKDQVRIQVLVLLQLFQRFLDLGPVVGKETVAKSLYDDFLALCLFKKELRAGSGLPLAFRIRAENNPADIHIRIAGKQLQNGTAAANLDVIGVRSQAQHLEWCRRVAREI